MWSGMPGKAQRFGGHGINKYAYKDEQRQAIKKNCYRTLVVSSGWPTRPRFQSERQQD